MIDLKEYLRELHMKSLNSRSRAGPSRTAKILLNAKGGARRSNEGVSDWAGAPSSDVQSKAGNISKVKNFFLTIKYSNTPTASSLEKIA